MPEKEKQLQFLKTYKVTFIDQSQLVKYINLVTKQQTHQA